MEYALSERLEGVSPDDQLDLLVWLARKCAEFKEANGLVGPVVHEGPLAVSSSVFDGEPNSFEALWAVWNRKRDDWKANAIEAYRDALAAGLGAQSLLTKAASYAEWERGTDIPAKRRKSLHKWLSEELRRDVEKPAKADSAYSPDEDDDFAEKRRIIEKAADEGRPRVFGFAVGEYAMVYDGGKERLGIVAELTCPTGRDTPTGIRVSLIARDGDTLSASKSVQCLDDEMRGLFRPSRDVLRAQLAGARLQCSALCIPATKASTRAPSHA